MKASIYTKTGAAEVESALHASRGGEYHYNYTMVQTSELNKINVLLHTAANKYNSRMKHNQGTVTTFGCSE